MIPVIKNRIICLFVLRFNIPTNHFSVISVQSHSFLGITSTSGSKLSCSRTQHGGGRFVISKISRKVL